MKVQDIIDIIDTFAPPQLADDGDPIGLQSGRRENNVSQIMVCVDVTPSVVQQAIKEGAEMIISHHALIYAPIRSMERTDAHMDALTRLVAKDISVYVAHTNYDSAPGGINDVLAETLGLMNTQILTVRRTERFLKLVVFVPPEALNAVRDALSTAGAGVIGNYTECSFSSLGKGSFRPQEGADPYTGKVGELEEVNEVRLEMQVVESLLPQALDAMRSAHPYEEVAYDIYRLDNPPIAYGFGRIGMLPKPVDLASFAAKVNEQLGVQGIRMVGDPAKQIQRVAVCGGSGDSFIYDAHRAGADVYVAGTASYHRLLDADALGLAFIDAGHFETERPGMKRLALRLARELEEEPIEVNYVE